MTATRVELSPLRANEAGKTFITYNIDDQFIVIVPGMALFDSRTGAGPAPRKVHVFLRRRGSLGIVGNDVLTHGLRAASAETDWITIGVHSAHTISDAPKYSTA